MLKPEYASAFNRDIKRCQKCGLEMALLKAVVKDLLEQNPLDPKYRDHPLYGNWVGYRELHILPDWLLIYRYSDVGVYFARTGSHSDLLE